MQAITFSKYGSPDVLQISEVKKPTPKANELLIRVHATTVSSGDGRARQGNPFIVRFVTGLFKPKLILGSEIAGEVEAVGNDVTTFKKGEAVFGSTGMDMGAHAEFVCIPADGAVAKKPANLSFAEAAAIPFGATTALGFLNGKAKIQPGQKVLIYGASGSVGTAAVQLAKHFGAEVTAVCSTTNLKLVRALGADHTIDYTQEDFAHRSATYDIIFDAVGKRTFANSKNALTASGTFLSVALSLPLIANMVWGSLRGGKKVVIGVVNGTAVQLNFLKERIEAGQLQPAIDKQYPFTQIAEAHKHVDKGRKKGNVVVMMQR